MTGASGRRRSRYLSWLRRGTVEHGDGAKPNLFYFGVGSIDAVSSGLDRVTRLHWREIVASDVTATGFLVDPTAVAATSRMSGQNAKLHVFPPDGRRNSSEDSVGVKLASLLRPHSLLKGMSLRSALSTARARGLAARRKPSIVVVDHIYAAQNLPAEWLFSPRMRLIFIAHDHMPLLIRDLYEDRRGFRRTLGFLSDFVKSTIMERVFLMRASRVVFLSDHDQALYPRHADKSVALLPFDAADGATSARAALAPRPMSDPAYVVFVGSPKFLPNRHAIRWICDVLSPALFATAPACRVILVGKGTAELSGASPNVIGKGFVEDDELAEILRGSLALLSPIEHGSGLKIKVLDALDQGIPVVATKLSLQGFGAFDLPLAITLDDPQGAAALIARLASGRIDLDAMRSRLTAQVSAYRETRKGRLARLIADVLQDRA